MHAVIELLTPLVGRFKRSGEEWMATSCPFHRDRTPSFAVNVLNGCWLCHSCGEKGTLPRLLRLLGLSRRRVDILMSPLQEQLEREMQRGQRAITQRFSRNPYRADPVLPNHLLGVYDYCPVDLVNQGFSPELLHSYDIGYDPGLHRITFPIRDVYGNLAGISGRAARGQEPRYKVYSSGFSGRLGWIPGDFGANFDDEYPGYQLDKRRFLWNGHEALPLAQASPVEDVVVVVEGFKAALWVIQCGYPLTVAIMGSSLSTYQADLLRRLANPIVLWLDNNLAGHHGTRKAVQALARSNLVRTVAYPSWADDSTQPDDIPPGLVPELIGSARKAYWKRGKQWKT